AVWEVFGALSSGARFVVAEEEGAAAVTLLARRLRENDVTHITLTPTLLATLDLTDTAALECVGSAGEAAPSGLLQKHARQTRVINAYGPTETAICAAAFLCGDVTEGNVPIGRPLPGVRLYVLDDQIEPLPLGVPGRLYIGGAGVGRGYASRSGLTAERFLPDPFSDVHGARMYDSGDRCRWVTTSADPEAPWVLEFLGRVDDQVKLRGFRIEPGEIEAALSRHETVRGAAVAMRDGQLVAWLEPHRGSEALQRNLVRWRQERVSQWRTLYESSYGQRQANDLAFDITGWNSSYTGQPILADEMREWVDATVARIREVIPTSDLTDARPRVLEIGCPPDLPTSDLTDARPRVLEIGCGTGLLLARLAPDCATYVGIDFSRESVTAARALCASRADLAHVELEERTADDTAHLPEGGFDLVILNSIIQYFPGVEYLERVVRGALRLLAPGGRIFLGDLRHLELLPAFQASIALHKAVDSGGSVTTSELRVRTERGVRNEEELLLSPALFTEWKNNWTQIARVEVTPKRGHARNELTKYRYDAVLFT
ncbi:MAG: methyltransferase domain-containing protein, partial [Proteobacteria bacterium]|nr:methyltransferase domain-containing protein [Pseudomonadota bacterium]